MNLKLTALAFLLIGLQACTGKKKVETKGSTPNRNPVLKVDGYIVRTSTTHQDLEIPGSLEPYEVTEVHPEVPGKITGIYFSEGRVVGRGSMLAKLFDADLQAQKRKLQVQLQTALKTEERQNELLKIHAISQQDYDLAMLQVSSYRADIQILNASLQRTEIRAPFTGKVGFRNVSVGAYVTPATVLTTIKQEDRLKLTFSIPEKYSSKVSVGSPIAFSVEGAPGKYAARIIATQAGITEATRSLQVKAVVEKVDKYLSSGAFAKVTFDLGEDNASLMVPSQAILPQARGKKVIVYRGGAVSFQNVTTGIRDSAMVQITGGLAVGDTILTTGLLSIKPNSKVQLARVK